MPKDNLDSLVKKAEALEAMVRRGAITTKEAAEIMENERKPWIDDLTKQVLGADEFNRIMAKLKANKK